MPLFTRFVYLIAGFGLPLIASFLVTPGASSAEDSEQRAQPGGFFYGLALSTQREIYAGVDDDAMLLPIIGYRGEKLQVFGPFVSYEFHTDGDLSLEAKLSPRFDGYEDSDSDAVRGMDEREASLDIGLGATFRRAAWKLELAALHDMLDRSDGYELSAAVGQTYRAGAILVEPAFGLSYLDSNHVDYYYGVENDEVTASRPAFTGDGALNTRLSLGFVAPSFLGGLARVSIEHTWFDSAISDSPIVDEDSAFGLLITYSRFFDS